jgi:anti-anti-sigma factor
MNLEISTLDDGIKRVNLVGRLDMQGTAEIEDTFLIQTATKKQAVLVDVSGVEFIASIGMRMLLSNAKALVRREGKMVLLNPVPIVKDALKTAGIDELIPVYDDFDAACADLRASVK